MTEAFVAKANADAARIVAAGGVAPLSKKQFTLYFIVEPERVLLGIKKKGFGAGKINGFGGKVEATDKTPRDAALRELHEEAGIVGVDPVQRGVLYFEFVGSPLVFEVFVFVSTQYEAGSSSGGGGPVETDEMKPVWYPKHQMPYAQMWRDDEHWFPHLFAGRYFRAFALFDGHDTMRDFHLELFDESHVASTAAEAVRGAGAPAHCVEAARQADVARVAADWMVGLWETHVIKRPRGVKWAHSTVPPLPPTSAAAAGAETKADGGSTAPVTAPAATAAAAVEVVDAKQTAAPAAAAAATAAVYPVTGKSAPAPAMGGAGAAAGAGAATGASAAVPGVCPVTGKSAPLPAAPPAVGLQTTPPGAAAAAAAAAAAGNGDGKKASAAAADPLTAVPIRHAPPPAEYVVVPIDNWHTLPPGKIGRTSWATAVRQTFTDLGLSLNAHSTPELHARLQHFVETGTPMLDVVAWSPGAKQVTDRPLFSITAPTKATAPQLFA